MSHHSSKYTDRDRRRSSSNNRRDHRRRSSSPGPSRHRDSVKPRDAKELPESFGGGQGIRDRDEDLNILQRMKSSYVGSPLSELMEAINSDNKKLKVWTRNFKEVRGICTGILIAFDKHWNLIMKEVDEVYLKSRKCKTPFLRDVKPDENIPEMQPKVPKPKKTAEEIAAAEAAAAAQKLAAAKKAAESSGDKPAKKKRKKKKKGPITEKRHICQFFIRGDNIVMVALVEPEKAKEPVEEEDIDEVVGDP